MSTRVNILKQNEPWHPAGSSGFGIFDPVAVNEKILLEAGIEVRFFGENNIEHNPLADCDVLIIESQAFISAFGNPESQAAHTLGVLEMIYEKQPRLVWFDTRDSAGTTQFSVLPFCRKYLKKQLYKDKTAYAQISKLYGGRLFTDFYHRRFFVCDSEAKRDPLPTVDLSATHVGKLQVAWNIGLERTDLWLGGKNEHGCSAAVVPKRHLLMAAMSAAKRKETIAYQRKACKKKLEKLKLPGVLLTRVPFEKYRAELTSSVGCLSCFGWGEICYRDFESFACGSILLKPDISCIDTWPNIFEASRNYLPFAWDLSDFEEKLEMLSRGGPAMEELGEKGRTDFYDTISETGMIAFCERFQALIKDGIA
jgi:hypothetical protein